MWMRAFLLPLTLVAMTLPAAAERLSLAAISKYLNGLTTVETDFIQENADFSVSTGKVYIKRPGRLRFEYDAPDPNLVIAGGGQVAIFDAKSNQPPEQYPLKRTPLNLILGRNIDLAGAKMVVGHEDAGNHTVVVAQDPERPEYGTLRLIFSNAPVELREWIVTDEMGHETRVILGDLVKGGELSVFLFSINYETEKRRR